MSCKPLVIVTVMIAGRVKYLFDSKVCVDKKRRPIYTNDVEKAKRFWSAVDANNYTSCFATDGKTKFDLETYEPARSKAA